MRVLLIALVALLALLALGVPSPVEARRNTLASTRPTRPAARNVHSAQPPKSQQIHAGAAASVTSLPARLGPDAAVRPTRPVSARRHHSHASRRQPNDAASKLELVRALEASYAPLLPHVKGWVSDFIAKHVSTHGQTLDSATKDAASMAPFLSDVPVPYTSCSHGDDIVTIQSLTSNVWPPKLGANLTITAKALVSQQINDGDLNVLVSFDGFQLLNQTKALSSLPDLTLPIPAGPWLQSANVTLPSSVPLSGQIGLQVAAKNEKGAELFCIQVSFQV